MTEKHAEGFSLVELMMTLAVAAITLGLGVPALTNTFATNRMAEATNALVSSLHTARSEAVKRGAIVTLCPAEKTLSQCDPAGNPAKGWIVFVDLDADGARAANELLLSQNRSLAPELADRVRLEPDLQPAYVAFSPSGGLADLPGQPQPVADIQLCDHRGDVDVGGGIAAGRWIHIAVSGRPQLVRERAQLQGPGNPLGGC